MAAMAFLAAASLAGIGVIRSLAASTRKPVTRPAPAPAAEDFPVSVPPEFTSTDGKAPETRSRLVLATLPGGRIMVMNGNPGEESLALYSLGPEEGLLFEAGRKIRWDLSSYDFSSNGKGLPVAEAQRAIEESLKWRKRGHEEEIRAREAKRQADEERVKALNEDEARRLRERSGK
jgi:hypothetical protein